MAKVKPRAHGVRYPWKKWLSETTTIRKGTHYHVSTFGMVNTIRQASRRLGVSVSLQVGEQSITIRRKGCDETA